jgi:hypothetical protein
MLQESERPANPKLRAASRVRAICGGKRDSHCIHAQTQAAPAYIDIPRSARRFFERLGPYQSLLVLAVPLAIVEPLKLIALFVVGEGHFIAGVLVIYAGSLFVTERLFVLLKPKLLTRRWFAIFWSWFVAVRTEFLRWLRRKFTVQEY